MLLSPDSKMSTNNINNNNISSSGSGDGYGSIERNDSEASPLLATTDTTTKTKPVISKHAFRLILGALLVGAVLLIGGRAVVPRRSSSIRSSGRNNNNYYYYYQQQDEEGESSPYIGDDDTFRLSPINDMGMLSLEREEDALPSSVWGSHLEQNGHPLPTNSWYLVRTFRDVKFPIPFISIACVVFGLLLLDIGFAFVGLDWIGLA